MNLSRAFDRRNVRVYVTDVIPKTVEVKSQLRESVLRRLESDTVE